MFAQRIDWGKDLASGVRSHCWPVNHFYVWVARISWPLMAFSDLDCIAGRRDLLKVLALFELCVCQIRILFSRFKASRAAYVLFIANGTLHGLLTCIETMIFMFSQGLFPLA